MRYAYLDDVFRLRSVFTIGDMISIIGGSQQRVDTLELRRAVRPLGGGGPGNYKRFNLFDAVTGHYATAWLHGGILESVPLARELGFNAGVMLQDLGWERVMAQVEKGNTLVLPLFAPCQVGGPDWQPPMVPPGSRYSSSDAGVDGLVVPSPDLKTTLFEVVRTIHEIAAQARKRFQRTDRAAALDQILGILRGRAGLPISD